MASADDRTIWRYALGVGAVIISKDEDFSVRRLVEPAGPAVVWVRLGNTRRTQLLGWFAAMVPEVVAALERGETLVEIA